MQANQLLTFGLYQCNPYTGQLWRGKQEVRLTPKVSTVLCYLVEHAGQIITKEALFAAAWPNAVVCDAALTSCIQELREALHDSARKPRYIETVHRRGYRFIAEVQSPKSKVQSLQSAFHNPHSTINLVGRAPDLAFLHERLAKALNGERQIVFVTGEPGTGKTTLIEVFRKV